MSSVETRTTNIGPDKSNPIIPNASDFFDLNFSDLGVEPGEKSESILDPDHFVDLNPVATSDSKVGQELVTTGKLIPIEPQQEQVDERLLSLRNVRAARHNSLPPDFPDVSGTNDVENESQPKMLTSSATHSSMYVSKDYKKNPGKKEGSEIETRDQNLSAAFLLKEKLESDKKGGAENAGLYFRSIQDIEASNKTVKIRGIGGGVQKVGQVAGISSAPVINVSGKSELFKKVNKKPTDSDLVKPEKKHTRFATSGLAHSQKVFFDNLESVVKKAHSPQYEPATLAMKEIEQNAAIRREVLAKEIEIVQEEAERENEDWDRERSVGNDNLPFKTGEKPEEDESSFVDLLSKSSNNVNQRVHTLSFSDLKPEDLIIKSRAKTIRGREFLDKESVLIEGDNMGDDKIENLSMEDYEADKVALHDMERQSRLSKKNREIERYEKFVTESSDQLLFKIKNGESELSKHRLNTPNWRSKLLSEIESLLIEKRKNVKKARNNIFLEVVKRLSALGVVETAKLVKQKMKENEEFIQKIVDMLDIKMPPNQAEAFLKNGTAESGIIKEIIDEKLKVLGLSDYFGVDEVFDKVGKKYFEIANP